MKQLGLIGKKLAHSFSKKYFEKKFKDLGLREYSYNLYELDSIQQFPDLVNKHPDLIGLNVTIPYKTEVIPYLDSLDLVADRIGAVNTIKFLKGGNKGYNTDYFGFMNSIQPWKSNLKGYQALILGSGGASRAVKVALEDLNINYQIVSRSPNDSNKLSYEDLDQNIMEEHKLIVNTTPVGMYPNTDFAPPIPIQFIGPKHYVYDLIYNPEETKLIRLASSRGAQTLNGLEMLYGQANKAWEIWTTMH